MDPEFRSSSASSTNVVKLGLGQAFSYQLRHLLQHLLERWLMPSPLVIQHLRPGVCSISQKVFPALLPVFWLFSCCLIHLLKHGT